MDDRQPPEVPTVAGYVGYVEWTEALTRLAAARLHAAKHSKSRLPQAALDEAIRREIADPRYSYGVTERDHFLTLGLGETLRASVDAVARLMSPRMLVHVEFPWNGEPPKAALIGAGETTPPELHYVRNHGNIPLLEIAADEHVLEIGGLVPRALRLTLRELRTRFAQRHVAFTLQCAGNRRATLEDHATLTGDPVTTTMWTEQAIGNSVWTGVSLRDVLEACGGVRAPADEVEFVGMDTVVKLEHTFNYACSVPLRKVLQFDEVLLAYEQNGAPLTAIHGAPVRALVLGHIGARSVKWLKKIVVRIGPSMAPSQRAEYRLAAQNVSKHNFNFLTGVMLTDMPINSCIMSPTHRQVITHRGTIDVAGWAFAGGGRTVERIEVSCDRGATWQRVDEACVTPRRYYAWRLWRTRIEVPRHVEGWIELAVRAIDDAINYQPADVASIWNWHGYLCNTLHRVQVFSVRADNAATAHRLAYLAAHGDALLPLYRGAQEEPGKDDPADAFTEGEGRAPKSEV